MKSESVTRALFGLLFFFVFCLASRKTLDRSSPLQIPSEWTTVGPAPRDSMLKLIIALKQQNLDKLEKIFWDVSNLKSSNYGRYLTIDDITQLVSPPDESIDRVNQWLDQNGIFNRDTVANKDFIYLYLTVDQAERLLDTQYHIFLHKESGKQLTKSLGPYTVPDHVADSIDFVTGAIGFPKIRKVISGNSLREDINIGPLDLRRRYNISDNVFGKNPKNKQAVAEFQEEYFSQTDLDQFFKQYVTFGNFNSTVAKIIGQNDPTDPGIEANLDIQYIMGVAPGVPTWFWSNPNFDFWGDLVTWTSQIDNTTDAPYVHSISYGDQAEGPAGSYKDKLNVEFQKMGTRGISIIFASGDSGTGCDDCYYFQPSFPATSPYVTSVGATAFIGTQVGPEEAVDAFGSGGGMSWHFPQPSYQKQFVDTYFQSETDLPESHYYNRNGRGTPDVSALGIGFQVVVSGTVESVGGTSASAPTFAAIVSLLNEIRLNANKSTLGFLNPWIYQIAASNSSAFYDVTVGNNQYGCCFYTGFLCAPGWDPVTGVGTPNYAVLQKLV